MLVILGTMITFVLFVWMLSEFLKFFFFVELVFVGSERLIVV